MVLVVAHTFEFERLVIEKKALFGVEANCTKAAARDDLIDLLTAELDRGSHFVQRRCADGPELWRRDGYRQLRDRLYKWINRQGCAPPHYFLPGRVHQRRFDLGFG